MEESENKQIENANNVVINENITGVYSAAELGFNNYTNFSTTIRFSDSYFDN